MIDHFCLQPPLRTIIGQVHGQQQCSAKNNRQAEGYNDKKEIVGEAISLKELWFRDFLPATF